VWLSRPRRGTNQWDRCRPRPQRPLPIALVIVDDLEAAGLVPPDLEDLLADRSIFDFFDSIEPSKTLDVKISG
jgi:hypothetical protein